ncbi:hypothetical protein Trydic_g3078 [Trypoxylus dichotomus]
MTPSEAKQDCAMLSGPSCVWSGTVPKLTGGSWTRRILQWRLIAKTYRSRGRPSTRWSDDVKRLPRSRILVAQDRKGWQDMRKAYVQQWTV